MIMQTNKEVIEELKSYLMTQSPEDVARMAANLFIDLNRFLYFEELSEDERVSLIHRTSLNIKETLYLLSNVKEKRSNIEIVTLPPQ